MILFKKAETLSAYIDQQKEKGQRVGFIPTMGALHQGHLTLIAGAKKKGELTVCSIFVNPTQFNNPNDFKHYPVTLEKDIEQLIINDCDALFLPPVKEIYPDDYKPPHYDLGSLESILEGHYRPGHFQGVCQVVDRLLTIVQPHHLYLGQKDYQQCKVIDRLITLLGKQEVIQLIISPTIREADGLAMSSRNLRLSGDQRKLAPTIFQALTNAKNTFRTRPADEIKMAAIDCLTDKGFKVDYFEMVNASTLLMIKDNTENAIALTAAYLGDIRLIDNLLL